MTEGELVARSEAFEQAVAGGDRTALRSFCAAKEAAADGEEAETWAFLGLMFEVGVVFRGVCWGGGASSNVLGS